MSKDKQDYFNNCHTMQRITEPLLDVSLWQTVKGSPAEADSPKILHCKNFLYTGNVMRYDAKRK